MCQSTLPCLLWKGLQSAWEIALSSLSWSPQATRPWAGEVSGVTLSPKSPASHLAMLQDPVTGNRAQSSARQRSCGCEGAMLQTGY